MELEDMLLGKAAKSALSQSQMVGAQTFVETLKQLANQATERKRQCRFPTPK